MKKPTAAKGLTATLLETCEPFRKGDVVTLMSAEFPRLRGPSWRREHHPHHLVSADGKQGAVPVSAMEIHFTVK